MMAKGDNVFFFPAPGCAPDVNVHVEALPAPNGADAARLLRELEQESRARLVDAMRLDNNYLKAVAQSEYRPATNEHAVRVDFSINGLNLGVSRARRWHQSREEFLLALGNDIAREIAAHVLAKVIGDLNLKGCGND